jgi:hypothetical protein
MTTALDATELDILATAIRRAAATRSGPELDAALDDIGWLDAVALAPRAAVAALFEAQGRACSTSGALGRLLQRSLGLDVRDGVPALLPAFGSARAPGARTGDGATEVHGLVALPATATDVVVVAASEPGPEWTPVPLDALTVRPIEGMDPDLGLAEVVGTIGLGDASWSPCDGDWGEAVATCRLAVGHELVGAMRTMLEQAREHALGRVQFDRPIAGFQAVRHRLAEALVALEAADAALDGAWADGSPVAAAAASAVCGASARTVRRHCQQVLAGIGFTTEHDLHRFVRRSFVLDGSFGDARTVTAELGAHVLARRALPDLLPL